MNSCLMYALIIWTFPISMPILAGVILFRTIKNNKEYDKYKKEMYSIYHKGYCPIIQKNCDYGYCEFWNENTKECDLKK